MLNTMHQKEMIIYGVGNNTVPNSHQYFTQYYTAEDEDKKNQIIRLINMTHTMNKHFIFIGHGDMIAAIIEHKQENDVLMLIDMRGENQSNSNRASTFVDEALCLSLMYHCTYVSFN